MKTGIRPVDDHELAVGVSPNGNVALILADGTAPHEFGPDTAEAIGKALIASARYARDLRARDTAGRN